MTKTTTTLGAITPGEAMLGDENDACASVQLENGNCVYFDRVDPMSGKRVNTREEMLANVDLVIDTFNTAQKTGKLPSQLLQERDELVGALTSATNPTGGQFNNYRVMGMCIVALRNEGHKTLAAELDAIREEQLSISSKYPKP